MIFKTKTKMKKFLLVCKLAFLSSFTITACALPINRLDNNIQIVKNTENNLKKYNQASYSDNYLKLIEKWMPKQVDNSLDNDKQYTSDYLLEGKNYIELVRKLKDEDIKNDIKDYLINETQTKEISIDFFDSWEFEFQTIPNLEKKVIQNFYLNFDVTNYGLNEIVLFEHLVIAPMSNATINISFGANTGSTIEPWYVLNSSNSNSQLGQNDNFGTYAASWIINIKKSPIIKITYNIGFFNGETKTFVLKNRWFAISGKRSYALAKNFENFYNLPNYLSMQEIALKRFLEMSNDDYANDLMDWYLTYYRYQYYLALKDLKFIMNYFFIENLPHPSEANRQISIVEYAMIDKKFRETLFARFKTGGNFDDVLRKLLDQLFGGKIDYKTFYVLIGYIRELPLEEYIDKNLDLEFVWNKKPITNFSNINDPKISFDFEIKTTFKKDFYITTIGEGKYKNEVVKFDLKNILSVTDILKSAISESNILFKNPGILSLADHLLPHTFGIREKESYTINIKASNSSIQFFAMNNFAFIKKAGTAFGWAATDVKIDLDFSGLNFLWESIARKLDNYNLENKYPKINENIGDEIAKRHAKKDNELNDIAYNEMLKLPKKEHLTILNAMSLASKLNDGLQVVSLLNDLYNKPFSKLLKGLVRNTFTIDSYQLEIGVSRAFYKLPEKYDNEPLWIENKESNKIIFKQNPKLKFDDIIKANKNQEFNFPIINDRIQFLNDSYSREIYDITKMDFKWDQTELDKKIDKLQNDNDLLSNNVVELIKESYQEVLKSKWDAENNNENFLEQYKNFNAIEKVKVSLIKIDVLGAFKSVMNEKVKTTGLIGLALGNNIFGTGIVDFSKLPDALVKRNPWMVIINPGTSALPIAIYTITPVLDLENIFSNIRNI